MICDYLIVGAGSAGAALTSRLSGNADLRILLLEACPDYPSRAATPVDLLDSRHAGSGPGGMRRLWLVDASVMPEVPRVVPNLTVMMVAERVADGFMMDATEETA